MAKKNKLNNLSADELVESFMNRWEYEWDEVENFDASERRCIKSNLHKVVLERLQQTGEFRFTKAELNESIEASKEAVGSGSYNRPNFNFKIGLDEQCVQYINYFLANQEFNVDLNNQELDLIWGKLYTFVNRRYVQSGYTCLAIKKRELNLALDDVAERRHRKSVEAAMDRRDAEIRSKRTHYGPIGYNYCALGDE